MKYENIEKIKTSDGLRIVIVKGMPSPWSQAARAIFNYKDLDYIVGPQLPGDTNPELVEWSGHNSGPVVAFDSETPVHRWLDIVLLAERLAPERSILPEDGQERINVVGLSHEVSGDLGLGWWARVAMFHPAMSAPERPEALLSMAAKWGYSEERGKNAAREIAIRLNLLNDQLERNRARGSKFIVGDSVSALDFHWAAMSILVSPLSEADMPTLPGYYPMFQICPSLPEVQEAMTAILLAHRDQMFSDYFVVPFDYVES